MLCLLLRQIRISNSIITKNIKQVPRISGSKFLHTTQSKLQDIEVYFINQSIHFNSTETW